MHIVHYLKKEFELHPFVEELLDKTGFETTIKLKVRTKTMTLWEF